jgi:type IV secretory pathway TrbF-like protein
MGADAHNPYLAGVPGENAAGATFANDRYFRVAQNAKNWRLGFFGLLAAALWLSGGLVYVASRQQVVPYIVRVDELGNTQVSAVHFASAQDPIVIRLLLQKWIKDIRTLTGDMQANLRRMQDAYAMGLDQAQKTIAAYYHEHPPEETLKKGSRYPIKVHLSSVTEKTWHARWVEQIVSDGKVVEEVGMEATLEVALVQPQTREERERSPLGLWVVNVQWAHL